MIKTVEFAGKERPVKYGFNALALFVEQEKRGLEAIGENMSIPELLTFVYVGLKEGARIDGQDFDLTKEQIADALDEAPDALEKFFNIFADQMPKIKGAEAAGK